MPEFRMYMITITTLLALWVTPSFAQTPDKVDLELVDYFTAYEHSFRCDFSQSILKELDVQDEAGLEASLQDEIQTIQDTLDNDGSENHEGLLHSEKKMLRHQRRVLEKLLKTKNRKAGLQKFYQGLCSGSEFAVGVPAKVIAQTANVIGQSVTLPIRFVYRFFRGLTTGVVSDEPKLTLYEAMGKNKYRSLGFYGLYLGYKALTAFNPLLIPLWITPMADYLAMNVCETESKLRPEEYKFCTHYESVKQKFFQLAKKAEVLGVKLSRHKGDATKKKQDVPAKVTDENLCDYLQIIHQDKTNNEKFIEFKTVLLQMNTPGHFSHPDTEELKTPDQMMVKANTSSMATIRNVIISLAPRESIQEEMNSSGAYDEYMGKLKKLKKLQKVFGRLYRSNSKEECQAKKEKHEFNLADYDALKNEIDQDKNAGFMFQNKLVQKQIKMVKGRFQFFNKTKLNWEVISANTLNQVHEILRSPTVGNVILLAHSEGNYKKLVDSSLAQFPTSFFSDLSPSLMSLSFYSCHASFIESVFGLKDKFLASPTFYQKRKLYFAEDTKTIDGEGSLLSGFGSFLIRVDNDLVPLIEGNMLNQSLKGSSYSELNTAMCKISVGKMQVDQGSLSVIVNRRFVGTINRYETGTEFDFPCKFIDREENVVLLQNHSLTEDLKLSVNEFALKISGVEIGTTGTQHFTDPATKDYAGSKITFHRK